MFCYIVFNYIKYISLYIHIYMCVCLFICIYIKYVHLGITLNLQADKSKYAKKGAKDQSNRTPRASRRTRSLSALPQIWARIWATQSHSRTSYQTMSGSATLRFYFVFLIPAKLCWDCWILCSCLNQFESGHSPMVFQSPQLVGQGGTDPAVTPVEPPENLSNKRPLPFAIFCTWLAVHVVLG